jgi:hypothetical protein
VGAFAEVAVANLRAGLIETQTLVTNNLITNNKIVSPLAEVKELKTNIISPLPDSSEIVISLKRSDLLGGQTSPESGFGRLLVQNSRGETVASIDSSGNASFAGSLTSTRINTDEIQINTDATVSGTLYAKRIESEEISAIRGTFGELLARVDSLLTGSNVKENETNQDQSPSNVEEKITNSSLIESHDLTPLTTQTANIQNPTLNANPISSTTSGGLSSEGITQGTTNEPKNNWAMSADMPESTSSWELDSLSLTDSQSSTPSSELSSAASNWKISDVSQDLKITSNLKVLGRTSLADTTVAGQLMVDASLTLGTNGINSLAGPLYLNSLGLGPVDILNGKVVIDVEGNVQIAGNLAVGGEIAASSLVLKRSDLQGGQTSERNVASIDEEGRATFADLLVARKLTIATGSASLSEVASEQITDASIGKATIPVGGTAITIKTPQVTGASQVFVTPTTPTENKVLYVTNQTDGQFRGEIDSPINKNIEFNWWIIN